MRAKSAMARKAGIENQTEHQMQKTRMQEQDRKLFLKQAQEIKEKYREEIEKLKAENKRLKTVRDELITSKRRRVPFPRGDKTAGPEGYSATDENYLRILLDREKHETKIRKNLLFTLQDKLKQVEDNKLGYIQENPMMRTIRLLENRLDKVMIKYNQAQSVQQTYDQVVKRLKQQRVGYDSQLAAIEDCLRGKQHDFQELLLLAHDATHAKQAAFAELKRFQQRRVTVQQMRTKYIGEKRQEVHKQLPTSQIDHASRIDRTSPNFRTGQQFVSNYRSDENYQRQQLSDYEQAFRKLKQVTGVVDANQIIQKFKTQGLTTQSLQQLQANYIKKIDALKHQRQKLRQKLEQNKYVRQKDSVQRRRLDQIEQDLAKTTNQFERTNLKYTKISNELINIRAGVQHLKDLTAFYKVEGLKSDGLEDDLSGINIKLGRIYDVIRTDPDYSRFNYKSTANAVQAIMKQQSNFRNFGKAIEQDDEQD